jgi:hypothetical protein
MNLIIARLLLMTFAFLQLSILPTRSQSPEKLFGGLLGIMEKEIRKEERRRQAKGRRAGRVEPVKLADRKGVHDSGLRELPSIGGVKLQDTYGESQLRQKFRMKC